MQIIKTTILLGIMLGILLPVHGQDESTDYTVSNGVSNLVLALNRLEAKKVDQLKNAQAMFDEQGYAVAADMFKSGTTVNEADKLVWSKLATAARLNANYEEAAYWYQKVTQDGPLPQDLLYYAQALQATGNCAEAVKWFDMYNDSPSVNKVAYIKNCNEVDQFSNFEQVSFNSLKGLNTDQLEFSARPFKDGVVFTSNRGSNLFSRLVDNWTNNNYTDLYYSEKNTEGYAKPTLFKGAVNGKFHDGVAAFSNDDTVMYFTRNDNAKKGKKSNLNLKVYQVTNSDGVKWNSANELPFNGEDFSSCHPTVSEDGATMYFSSDRPGGFGGMDIYKVMFANGTWSSPVNVGPSINTAGNEIFPFLTAENDLAFSSNGHPGMGGLDVYVARQSESTTNTWDQIVNAGKPFNSIKDDFGFYMNAGNTTGYVSSGRIGEKSNDDIYEWKSDSKVDFFPPLAKEQIFCVVDQDSGLPIQNARVEVIQTTENNKSGSEAKTNSEGQFSLTILPETKVQLAMTKNGFVKSEETLDFDNMSEPESTCVTVKLKKVDAISILGRVVNKENNDSPISDAVVTLVNKCNDEEKSVKSNAKGEFNFDVPCECDYRVVAIKDDFVKQSKSVLGENVDCNDKKEIVLSLRKPVVVVKPELPKYKEEILKVGKIIPFENINYDFNKSTIRADAAEELDKIVALLNKYPELTIELGSHTDARGPSEYNQNLSAARAKSAVDYLIQKGIARERTMSRGYGESNLLNGCTGNSECTAEQHEINRRTEIKVIKI